ncbi:MAG: hypothetical protein ACK504_06140 [Bacteroidota bacterium]
MKKIVVLSLLFFVPLLVILNSCNKKKELDIETQSVVDNALCEQSFLAIQPVVNDKGINENGLKKIATCETFSLIAGDTTDISPRDGTFDNGPVTFQIDYGATGCIGDDGVTRTGKINISTSRKWKKYGNLVSVDLVGYKANGITFTGQIKITLLDSVTLSTEIVNGNCTNGNWSIDYAGTKTMKQIAGFNTRNIAADDVFSITGNSSGKNRNGRAFTTSITQELIKKTNCKWITSGVLNLTPDGFATRSINYGNGTCDDDATFTVNGQTITFKLQ